MNCTYLISKSKKTLGHSRALRKANNYVMLFLVEGLRTALNSTLRTSLVSGLLACGPEIFRAGK